MSNHIFAVWLGLHKKSHQPNPRTVLERNINKNLMLPERIIIASLMAGWWQKTTLLRVNQISHNVAKRISFLFILLAEFHNPGNRLLLNRHNSSSVDTLCLGTCRPNFQRFRSSLELAQSGHRSSCPIPQAYHTWATLKTWTSSSPNSYHTWANSHISTKKLLQ